MSNVKGLRGDDPFGFNELSRYTQGLLAAVIGVFGANVLLYDVLVRSPRLVCADGIVTLVLAGLLITSRTRASE